jgi:amidophosphoribosyltransferase
MCGICLVYGTEDAPQLCRDILSNLQHRGRQSAEITVIGDEIQTLGGQGLVMEQINPSDLSNAHGDIAVGHTRYTTSGATDVRNTQPFRMSTRDGELIYAHNGQFGTPTDIQRRRNELLDEGVFFQRSADSELFGGAFTTSEASSLEARIADTFRSNPGSASIVGVIDRQPFAGRRRGNRPLFRGSLGDATIYASENHMFDDIGIENEGPVNPGSLELDDTTYQIWDDQPEPRFDIFELFYFSHPFTTYRGEQVSEYRKAFGARLAAAHPIAADVTSTVPDSGNFAADGYAEASGVEQVRGVLRNHYAGRTFIGDKQKERVSSADYKYKINRAAVNGKDVVLIDDSIVRGTTAQTLGEKLRRSGARRVTLLSSSPPIRHPHFYGIDMKSREELVAANRTPAEISEHLQLDHVGYLPLEEAYAAIEEVSGEPVRPGDFDTSPFTGEYWGGITVPAHAHGQVRVENE